MKLLLLFVATSHLWIVLGEDCNELGVFLYKDLGCTPEGDSNGCPSKYSCPGLDQWTTHCYYRGKEYQDQDVVSSNETIPHCVYCQCAKHGHAEFVCAYEDCFAMHQPGCRHILPLNKCCPHQVVCAPFETCEVDGKTYQEGDHFYPKNTCLQCICRKGFEGKLEEPFCSKQKCGVQLFKKEVLHEKCAPLYTKRSDNLLCCPDEWICPDGSEKFKTATEGCQFGDKIISVGDNFTKTHNSKEVQCRCTVPPLLTCKKM